MSAAQENKDVVFCEMHYSNGNVSTEFSTNYRQTLIFAKHACLFDALAEHTECNRAKRCTQAKRCGEKKEKPKT